MALRVLTISKPYVASAYRHKLALLAANRDFEIGLICPPAWGQQAYEAAVGPEPFPVTLLPIVANGRNHFHFYRGLTAAVRAFRPDVLNVEEEHYSLVTWQAFRAAAAVGAAPIFYTWQNILKSYPPPFAWMMRSVFAQAQAGVCGNAEAADVLRQQGYRGPLAEIPQMGVDPELFTPKDSSPQARRQRQRALGLDDQAFWVAFAGRLVPEKGVSTLLAAVHSARQAKPQLKVLILGDGPARTELTAQVAQLGLEQRVIFLPQVPSRAVASYLQAVDALVLPSLTRANWKEQFGRILIEAMAAQAVVVGSSSGEIPRVIGDAGLVFPEGDAAQLATSLVRLAQSEQLQASLRQAASQRVTSRFTNAVVADRFGELFQAVQARKQALPSH